MASTEGPTQGNPNLYKQDLSKLVSTRKMLFKIGILFRLSLHLEKNVC